MLYEIKLNGYNFMMINPLDNNDSQKLGFFATRIVDAANEDAAIEQAISLIKNDPAILAKLANDADDMPNIGVEAIREINANETSRLSVDSINKAYMFYPDNED